MDAILISIKEFKQREAKMGFVNVFTGSLLFFWWEAFFIFVVKNVFIGSQTQYLIKSYYLFSKVL